MAAFELDVNGKLVTNSATKKRKKKSAVAFELDPDGKVKQREQEIDQELAPSKKEDGGKLDFFKKSSYFDDGWQLGDGVKAFSASVADMGLSLVSGVAQNVEGITDFAGHLLAGGADALGADKLAGGIRKIAKHDTVQTAANWLRDPEGGKGIGIGEGSIFGRTSQGVGQAVGQIGGLILTGAVGGAAGLGAKGVSALTTGSMFASSTGAGISEAYNAGASDAEAWAYGTIKGGVDTATELIFGGLGKGVKALGISHGLSSFDDVVAKKLSAKLSQGLAKTMVQAGVKASGEGFEEVLAGLGTAAAKKLTYMSDTELKQLVEDENLLEQFVVGAIASGFAQSGGVVQSVKNDTDFITGLNKSEETVVQKEYEKRLAIEEKNGKALTKKEQNAIYDEVLEDLDNGDISIDTIEEALGGEDYTKYQDAFKSEETLKKEYEKLANTPKGELTHIQEKLLNELEKQIAEEPKSKALKQQLEENVFNLSQGNRFMSSYAEKANRAVAFQADVSQYDEKQRQVVQKAIDSGILNNTKKTHNFVDMLAKLSAEKGVSFDFVNNQKLKDSMFALNGKTVNGYVTKDGITLNIDSKKALNTVVGHEITHILEGTKLYDSLQKAIFEYAQTKGEYDSRLATITELYKDIKDADINGELTADLVGDYLFADNDFIARLSTENRSLFRTIWDEIKYLASIATAGSKEARQLKKVEKAFADAFRGEGKKVEGTKLAISENVVDKNGTKYDNVVTLEYDVFDKVRRNGKAYIDFVRNNLIHQKITVYSPDGNAETVEFAGEKEKVKKDGAKNSHPVIGELTQAKNEIKKLVILNAKETAEISDFVNHSTEHSHQWLDENGWDERNSYVMTKDGMIYPVTLHIAKTRDGRNILYDVNVKIKEGVAVDKIATSQLAEKLNGQAVKTTTPSSGDSVARMGENVKRQFSLTADSEGRELSPAVKNRFANSKVLDENGDLKVVYHGTAAGEFSIFDKSKGSVEGDFGSGFYFTDNESDVTENYEDGGADFENKVARLAERIEADEEIDYEEAEQRAREELYKGGHKFEVYLNIENPAIVGETMLFENEKYLEEYAEEDFDSYDDYIAEVEKLVSNDIENIVWEVEKNVDVYSTDGLADILFEAYYEGGIGIEELKSKINELYLEDNEGNLVGNEVARQIIESLGYDGIIDPTVSSKWNMNMEEGTTHYIVFKPNQIKAVSNQNPTDNPDIHLSLSPENAKQAVSGRGNVYGRDVALEALPIRETAPTATEDIPIRQTDANALRDDNLPMRDDTDERLWSLTDEDAPAEVEPNTDSLPSAVSDPLADKTWAEVGNRKVKAYMYENPEVKPYFQQEAQYLLQELRDTVKGERIYYETEDGSYGWTGTNRLTSDTIATLRDEAKLSYKDIEKGLNAIIEDNGAENIAAAKRIELVLSDRLINGYTDFLTGDKIPPNQEYINTLDHMQRLEASEGNFDSLMEIADDIAPKTDSRQDLKAEIPVENPPAESPAEKKPILTVKERLEAKLNNLETELADIERQRQESWQSFDEEIGETVKQWESKKNKNTQTANDLLKRIARRENNKNTVDDSLNKRANDIRAKIEQVQEEIKAGESPKEQAAMRREVHEKIISDINEAYRGQGFEFDDVLKNAKDLSTFATVDNTPQRVMEKALGYKQGKILADMTVNKVAQNETEGIKWLNRFTDRKNGLIAQISKQYNIKPGSKESAAAQMYAEGFYVNDKNEIVEYKDRELAMDFPDARVRENIKGLAKDKRIREIYDATLDAINASRRRNAYPEIKKLDNYFLHFRAQTDTFSRLGIPFNPNDIKAKDLPTDLNGVTADLKPGQPYFASSMHRKGKRTSFDLLGGLEQYLTSAKDQIYHIDDIQTLRALRNYIADNYGQAKGLDNLDALTEEEQEAKIKEVFDAHLSTFAKFLNEEANVIAGKTSLTDRGLEGVIGRKGITLLDTINRQVGANMVGFNVSSSLTNFLSVTQAFAKSNKADFVKAMAQTVSNKLGKGDGFAESSPVMIRRKGADRFARKPWQKAADAGYVLMQAVDNISTEIIARAKYNELTRKGLTSEQAHIETDKWVSRLMGDRSLGQQPQLYNSKMLGLFTKFQLEVRNQLDSQFYDTVQEAKESTEDIKNATERNAKVAAKVASKLFQLAVVQHLFGKAFESVAGYNPAFDIIGVLVKTLGLDDEEEDDDTALDNIEQGFLELMGDLPYTSTLTGGRVPISSALPITQFFTGKDQYGNEKSRVETVAEALPYFVLPGGYGQIKKTTQGLSMFDDDLPIAGSYTDSGNLRFPVEKTLPNVAQAAVFGQWASKNAREYFDNEYAPLKEKQIQEYIDSDLPIAAYRDYREGLKGKDTLGEKVAYIASLDLPISTKNMLVNNIADRKEPIDLANYGEYEDWGEFEYAHKYPEKYDFLQANNISAKQYESFDEDTKAAWSWAYQNPGKFKVAKAVASDVVTYREYTKALNDIEADKDSKGKSISGSRKNKVTEYINSLELDYGAKIILFKTEYTADDTYNREIVEYLNSREELSFEDIATILRELEFEVLSDGTVRW